MCAKLCLMLYNPMDCSMSGFPVHHYLIKSAQTHVHWVSDVIQPSHLLSPSSPALNLSSIRVFYKGLALCIKWPNYWSFSLSISTFNEYLRLISFRIDWFDLLAIQRILKCLFHTTIRKHQFFNIQPSFFVVRFLYPYMTTGKTTALTVRTFVSKVMSLLFNMQSRFVIAFLPRIKVF